MKPVETWLAEGSARLISPVLTAALAAVLYPFTVESVADYVVTDTRQVLYPATPHQHYRVLLKVMAYTTDISSNFHPISQSHSSDFTKRRVRLLRGHGPHLYANAPPLRTARPPLYPVTQ